MNIRWYVVGKLRSLAYDDPHAEFYIEEFIDDYAEHELDVAKKGMEYVRRVAGMKHQEIQILKIFPEVLNGLPIRFCPRCGNELKNTEVQTTPLEYQGFTWLGVSCKRCYGEQDEL